MAFLGIFVSTVVCAYLCGRIAERGGRSVKAWVWLGALFGPVALGIVAALPRARAG